MIFSDFPLDREVLHALNEMQYKEPSEIQEAAIPVVLSGKDLIALAKTGSGKTAASAIPICHIVDPLNTNVQALIIVPTRELAMQYAQETQKVGKYRNVKAFGICGGEDASLQLSKLKSGVQVLVATPGRLIDFIYSRSIDLSHVKILVLDEADEMMSMGFIDDLEFIMQCLNHPHQTLLFSATMPKRIRDIAITYLKDPVEVEQKAKEEGPSQIEHFFLYTEPARREEKLLEQIRTLHPHQAIVFCHSRIQAEKVSHYLKRHIDHVDLLHAGFTQDIRSIVTSKFRQKKVRVLVATDVVARGLDFSSVTHVFIFELSADPDTYVHRAGRTGRFDKTGVVVTLVTRREMGVVEKIKEKLKAELNWIEAPPATLPPVTERRGVRGGFRPRR